MNYNNILTIDPLTKQGTRVTKVKKTDYGYKVQMFNNYITLYYLTIYVYPNKSAKIRWRIEKNYNPVERLTSYHNTEGNEITKMEFKQLNLSINQ